MTIKRLNSPAFPGTELRGQQGMTLRDWFAGQFVCGILASDSPDKGLPTPEFLARRAYGYADAMLEERAKYDEPRSL